MKKLYGIFALAGLIISTAPLVGAKKQRVNNRKVFRLSVKQATNGANLVAAKGDEVISTINKFCNEINVTVNSLALLSMRTETAKQQPKQTKVAFLLAHAEPTATVAMSDAVLDILIDVVAAKKELDQCLNNSNDKQLEFVIAKIDALRTKAKTTHNREQQSQ